MRRKWLSLITALLLLVVLIGGLGWTVYAPIRQERLNSALIAAIKENNTKMALTLLAEGADSNARDEPPPHLSLWRLLLNELRGKQPTHSTAPTALLLACSGDEGKRIPISSALVRALLDRGATTEVKDEDMGRTPLLWSISDDDREVSTLLIERGANVNSVDKVGDTPVMLAVAYNNKALVSLLVKRGANINAIKYIGQLPMTPLVLAQLAKKDDPTVTQMLISKGAKINEPGCWTPLHQAIFHHRPRTARVLLQHGGRAIFKMHYDYATIQLAKALGDSITIQWLKQAGYQK